MRKRRRSCSGGLVGAGRWRWPVRWPCRGGSSVFGVVGRSVWTEAWADGVRAGASATGGNATSAHMYICAGLRLSSADQVAVFFSAFWLRSSVVSVLISLISDIQAIGL